MTTLAEPIRNTGPLTHTGRLASAATLATGIASHPRQPTAIRLVDPVLPARPGHPPAGTEQLLQQRAYLPVGHPDRARLRTRVIEENLPMAGRLARRYRGRGELLDDLIQVAALALVKAVDRYDPDRSTSFAAFAVPTILGDLKRHFRDTAWGMRVPRASQELTRRVVTATGELAQRRGRLPTPAELAHHLDVTTDDLRAARCASQVYRLPSLNTPHATRPGVDLVDVVGGTDPGYVQVDDRLTMRLLLATLPDRERRIVTLRFYGHLTQTEIAAEVGLSQMHVSRLLKRTLLQLRTVMSTP